MIVKEVLLNALANAGHIHDGDSSEADEFGLALRLFNTEMKFYSSRNLITAYQAVLDIDKAELEQVIGKFNVRKGRKVFSLDALPEDTRPYVVGRDYVYCDGKFYELLKDEMPVVFGVEVKNETENVQKVHEGTQFRKKVGSKNTYIPEGVMNVLPIKVMPGETAVVHLIGLREEISVGDEFTCFGSVLKVKSIDEVHERDLWKECDPLVPCEYVPDVICGNMERIVTVMYRDGMGKYNKLRFVPLSQFYTEDDDFIFCTTAAGENKVKVIVPDYIEGKQLKIVYNTDMTFQKNDRLELPDNHIALVEIAVTVAILRHDADSDPTRLENYKAQLKEITDNIEATTVTERRIMRANNGESSESLLRSGNFIRRRLR